MNISLLCDNVVVELLYSHILDTLIHRLALISIFGSEQKYTDKPSDLFLFCYERDFMKSLSDSNQADIIEAFNSTSRYLDDLLNIDNPYFDRF